MAHSKSKKEHKAKKARERMLKKILQKEEEEDFPELKPQQDAGVTNVEKFKSEKLQYVENILKNTRPIRYLLIATGRFPFKNHKAHDGTYVFESAILHPNGIFFCVVSIITFYLLIIGCFNLTDLMLNLTFGNGIEPVDRRNTSCYVERMYEATIFDRHVVAFTCIWAALCHVTLSSINVFLKRDYIAKYLTFWTQVAKTVHVDVTAGTLTYSYVLVSAYIIVMLCFVMVSVIRVSASPAAAGNLFSVLMFRIYVPCILEVHHGKFTDTNASLEIFSGLLLVFIFIASKSIILLFLQACRMLTATLKVWNSRFETALHIKTRGASQKVRITYDILFDDHCILLSLLEGTDKCFAATVESYIAVEIVAIIMESYFVYKVLNVGSKEVRPKDTDTFRSPDPPYFKRDFDWAPGVIMLLIDVLILILILKEAGKICLVAREGLEVIRRKTTMTRKSEQELWFTLSMFSSYTYNDLALQGSGFFIFNNDFIITVLSIILSSVVAVVQFSPAMSPDFRQAKYFWEADNDTNWNNTRKFIFIQHFLKVLEKNNSTIGSG